MSTKGLKFDKTPELKFQPIDCPDHGRVMMLSDISAGAFYAYLSRRDDAERAFRDFVKESSDDQLALAQLTEADFDAIARYYAASMDREEEYEKARLEHGVFAAFRTALASTPDWKSHVESERTFVDRLNRSSFAEVVRRKMAELEKTLRALGRDRILASGFRASVITPSIQASLLKANAIKLVPRVDAISQLAAIASGNQNAWQDLIRIDDKLMRSLNEHTSWMSQIMGQIKDMQQVLAPVTDIAHTLQATGEQLRSAGLIGRVIANVDKAIAQSTGVVRGVNNYFSRCGGLLSPMVRPFLPPDVSSENRELFLTVADSAEGAETVMHAEAANLIELDGDAAHLIVNLLERRIDEKLEPYKNIMRRFARASTAGTFLDLLHAFAKVTGQKYWKNLWQEPGKTYLNKPERLAQSFLGYFLDGHWLGMAFVGREIGNGNGFVDLLVHFLGQDHVVELKIVGAGWNIGDAKAGLQQLDEYMQNYETEEAYLVVFDGRKTNKGEQLAEHYDLQHGTVSVVTVRVYFDAPSSGR